ncbi:MAG: hypothetical protein QOJ97_2470 [Solirubrobacteraceae bacterium]|nr:hypothetical protein [Solirubrobacteraceae bacterium]
MALIAAGLALAGGAVAIWLLGGGPPPPGTITGRTYYVSPQGSDAAAGTSAGRPWATVARVTRARLRPGDGVLFKGGAAFSDATLELRASGTKDAPIVYGSYSAGRARLTRGVFLAGAGGIVIQDLDVTGPDQGIASAGSIGIGSQDVTLQRNRVHDTGVGINSAHPQDSGWTIRDNTIARTRDSGLIMAGERALIAGNTITVTGRDPSIAYGKHGIYLKGAYGTVTGNRVQGFHDSGVSVRRRDSRVVDNDIRDGAIGISWFQEDTTGGRSEWRDNRISGTTGADVFVASSDAAGGTRESFVITGNRLSKANGVYLNLAPTTGRYTVARNVMR